MKKIILILACSLSVVFGSFAQNGNNKASKKADHKGQKHTEELQVLKEDTTDPVCKMSVPKGSKQVMNYKGKQVGFCSIVCKEMFEKNPEKYAIAKKK